MSKFSKGGKTHHHLNKHQRDELGVRDRVRMMIDEGTSPNDIPPSMRYAQGGKPQDKPGGSNVGKKTFADGSKRTGPYAGPSGGAPAGSYPIPDIGHAKAAIRLSGHAPNPGGIKEAVYRKYPQLKHEDGGTITMDNTNKRAILSRGVDASSHPLPFKHGGKIHIKPENRGKFNATKAKTGKSTEELTHSSNPITKKRAIFAQNAAKWHHADGGTIGGPGQDALKLLKERTAKRDSVRGELIKKFGSNSNKVNDGMLDYFQKEPAQYKNIKFAGGGELGDGSPLVGPGDPKVKANEFKHVFWKDMGVNDSTGRGPSQMYQTTFGALNRLKGQAIPPGANPTDVTFSQIPNLQESLNKALNPGAGGAKKPIPAYDISGKPAAVAGAHASFAKGGMLLGGGNAGYSDIHLGQGGTMDYPGKGYNFKPVTAFEDGGKVVIGAAKKALGHKVTPDDELNPAAVAASGLGGRVPPGGIAPPILMYNTGVDGREAVTKALKRMTPLPQGGKGMKMGQKPTSYGYTEFSGLGNSQFGDKTVEPKSVNKPTRANFK